MSNVVPNDSDYSCLSTVRPLGPNTCAIADISSTASHFCKPYAPPMKPKLTFLASCLPPATITLPLPSLTSCNSLGMGQPCDSGFRVAFLDAVSVTVHHLDRLILICKCTCTISLWQLSLVPILSWHRGHCRAFRSLVSHSVLLQLRRRCAIRLTKRTRRLCPCHVVVALPSHCTSNFIGFTERKLRTHPPHSVAMIKGHLDQTS